MRQPSRPCTELEDIAAQARALIVPRPLHADRHTQDLEFLSRSALEFAHLESPEAIVAYLAQRVSDLVGNAVTASTLVDHVTGEVRVCQLCDPLGLFQKAPSWVKPVRLMSVPPIPLAVETFKLGRLVRIPGGLDVLSFGYFTPDEARALEAAMGFSAAYAIGLAYGEELYGTVAIIALQDTVMPDPRIVETFVAQATLAVRQRLTEQKLLESERRFRKMVEEIPQTVIELDLEGRFTYANPHARSSMGLGPHEKLEGRNVLDFIVAEDHAGIRAAIARVTAGERVLGEECVAVRRDGTLYHVMYYAAPILSGGRVEGIRCVTVDITAHVEAEKARRLAEARLHHAERLEALSVLAGGLAHDFNNIFVAIIGNAELALQRLKPGSPEHERVQRIERAARRATQLTSQLLDYSGAGMAPLEFRPVPLDAPVAEAVALYGETVRAVGTLEVALASDLPPIRADAGQVRQVVAALLLNAAEAIGTGSGGGRVTLRSGLVKGDDPLLRNACLVSERSSDEYAYIEVSDTGPGMDEATRARVFDPFFSTKFPGRGLGLAAVLGIMRAHKGTIAVESEPGKGATFRVFCPVAAEPRLRGR